MQKNNGCNNCTKAVGNMCNVHKTQDNNAYNYCQEFVASKDKPQDKQEGYPDIFKDLFGGFNVI